MASRTPTTNPVGLLFKEAGELVGCCFDATKTVPLETLFPEKPAGPFLLEAEVCSPRNETVKKTVEMLAAVSDNQLHVMMKRIPIICSVLKDWHPSTGISHKFMNEIDEGEDTMFYLEASHMNHGDFFYFRFERNSMEYCTCMWSDSKKKLFNVPFYNFHTNGESCFGKTGVEENRHESGFSKLLRLLNGYTTPHDTYGTGKHFSLKMGKEGEDPTLLYDGMENRFPSQHQISAWMPPDCLATPEARAKAIGKLLPF